MAVYTNMEGLIVYLKVVILKLKKYIMESLKEDSIKIKPISLNFIEMKKDYIKFGKNRPEFYTLKDEITSLTNIYHTIIESKVNEKFKYTRTSQLIGAENKYKQIVEKLSMYVDLVKIAKNIVTIPTPEDIFINNSDLSYELLFEEKIKTDELDECMKYFVENHHRVYFTHNF